VEEQPVRNAKDIVLRKEALYVKVGDKHIGELNELPVKDLQQWFSGLEAKLSEYEKQVAKRVLIEINNRLNTLLNVGLGYLTMSRLANSLSGGESQRIQLTRNLGKQSYQLTLYFG
jgi:excinuclease ABC subunit A